MTIRSFQLLFILTIAVSLSLGSLKHEQAGCIHDKIAEKDPYVVNLAGQEGVREKRQSSATHSNIRIHPIFTNVASSVRSKIQGVDTPLARSIKTLESILMVHPVKGNLVIPPRCDTVYVRGPNSGKCTAPLPLQNRYTCGEFGVISSEYVGVREVCESFNGTCTLKGPNGTGIANTDYLLFVSASTTSNCVGNTLAYASACMLDASDNNRPVAGYINICPSALQSRNGQVDLVYGLMIHEIIHALGFSSRLFNRFVNEEGIAYNPTRLTFFSPYGITYLFTGPKTLEVAKSYYSCTNNRGVYLENEGGSGTLSSHWEKRTLHHEVMNGFISNDYVVLSELTVALLEDSGWYKANYTALSQLNQPPLRWGKGLGCSFLNERCTSQSVYPYLCSSSETTTCTYDHLSKGTCSTMWGGFDGCNVALADGHEDYCRTELETDAIYDVEQYGSTSICVDGIRSMPYSCGTTYLTQTTAVPVCVPQTSFATNISSQYSLQLQDKQYNCEDDHAVTNADSDWIVLCPPSKEIVPRSPAVVISEVLPAFSNFTTIAASSFNDIIGNVPLQSFDHDTVAFGGLSLSAFGSNVRIQLQVNSVESTPVCHLSGCSECHNPIRFDCRTCSAPQQITNLKSSQLPSSLFSKENAQRVALLYSVVSGQTVTASSVITDDETQSSDYSLLLLLDPRANHSFVYYAASVDFIDDHLHTLHSNDESIMVVIALSNDTEVRVALSKDAIGMEKQYGEEFTVMLNIGETLRLSNSLDLSGSRVTANKTISFYSGHYCATGSTDNCSVLIEQIPPFNSWGNSFILHTNVSGLIGNMFKLISSDIGASVSINCTSDGINYESNNYHLGFRQHLVLSITHHHCIVNSDENILIIQFKDSSQSLLDTFMTIIPAIDQFEDYYVFNTHDGYTNYVAITVKSTNPNIDSMLLNNSPKTVNWETVNLDGNAHYYGVLQLPAGRHTLAFSEGVVKFGAIIYGSSETDTYALPAGMKLNLATDLPSRAPSPVQDAVVTLVDGMINVTWTPPVVPNGIIYQYIVQRVNSSGKFYHHFPANQHTMSLPYFNDALVFVTAVNLYGQSVFERAESQDSCAPSPCINNGTCVILNSTDLVTFLCECTDQFTGLYCATTKLYPFGVSKNDTTLQGKGVIVSSPEIIPNKDFYFYTQVAKRIYVIDNGIISINDRYFSPTPSPFQFNTVRQFIAPYWADVDIRGTGQVSYRQTTDPILLARATSEIRAAFPNSHNVIITNLFIATWDKVSYYSRNTDKTNTFQCVLASSALESFAMFLYENIQWTTGDRTGANGFGGTEAIAGINGAHHNEFLTIPGSLSPSIISIADTSNIGMPGIYMFQVGKVTVTIKRDKFGRPAGNNTYQYLQKLPLSLTCMISSTAPPNTGVYKWKCSNGCFENVTMQQTISTTKLELSHSGSFMCSYEFNGMEYHSKPVRIEVIDFLPTISPLPIIRTVGKDYNISCTVSTPVGLNNSVNFTWETPSSVVIDNDRVTINNFVVVDLSTRIHYSTLQFAYYKETDFGRYNCLVMVDDESELLSAELTRSTARIPRPAVRVDAPSIQNFGQPLRLNCSVMAVTGISSRVDIMWYSTIQRRQLRRQSNVNITELHSDRSVLYTDYFTIPSLTASDNADTYTCEVIINSFPQVRARGIILLQLTSPEAAPKNFRVLSTTSTTIYFRWSHLSQFQSNGIIRWYAITCSGWNKNITVNIAGRNISGTVTGLTPFTNYSCTIHAVTDNAGPMSDPLIVMTDEAAPNPPVILSVTTIDSQSVHVTWRAPIQPNGVLISYTITYYFHSSRNAFDIVVPFNGETIQSYDITGLEPYQLVAVIISATNKAGTSGQSIAAEGRTAEAAPGLVQFQVRNSTDNTEAVIMWSPPTQPNGVITAYQVIHSIYENTTTMMSSALNRSALNYTLEHLRPGIPYQVTVVAFNGAGMGASIHVTFFSEELEPMKAPDDVKFIRLSSASVNITWTPLTLFEAQGFPNYQVTVSPLDSRNKRELIANNVMTNRSFAVLTNLDDRKEYSVIVGVTTGQGNPFINSLPVNVSRVVTNDDDSGEDSSAVGAIVGGVVGGIVVVVAITVIIVLVTIRYKHYYRKDDENIPKNSI